jgi:hypothetical protein
MAPATTPQVLGRYDFDRETLEHRRFYVRMLSVPAGSETPYRNSDYGYLSCEGPLVSSMIVPRRTDGERAPQVGQSNAPIVCIGPARPDPIFGPALGSLQLSEGVTIR